MKILLDAKTHAELACMGLRIYVGACFTRIVWCVTNIVLEGSSIDKSLHLKLHGVRVRFLGCRVYKA